MKTTILTLGFALLCAISANAQSTPSSTAPTKDPAKGDRHACIMAGADTWTTLGLSADQVTKVKEIQASCKADYGMAKEKDAQNTSVAKHEAELKAVLTPEQYTNWTKWCAERKTTSMTEPATMPEKK